MSHDLVLDWDADKTHRASPSRRGFSSPTSNHPDNNHNDNNSFHILKPHRPVAMKRDRNTRGDEQHDDRGSFGREPRIVTSDSHHRMRSPSPYSRRPRGYRNNDDYHRNERPPKEGGEKVVAVKTDHQAGDNPFPEGTRAAELPPFRGGHPDDIDRTRAIPTSPRHGPPMPGKRRRSRSPPPFPPTRPKKSRRDRGHRNRVERGPPKKFNPRYERPTSPFSVRSPSPNHDFRDRYADRVEPSGPHRGRHRSRSPFGPVGDLAWVPPPPPPSHPRNDLPPRDRSHSPHPNSRRSSFSRAHSSPRPPSRSHPGLGEPGFHSRRSPPPFDPHARSDHPPRSPRERGSRRSRKRGKRRDDARFPPGGGEVASGANSVEVNMSRRGEFRGSFSAQMPSGHLNKLRYDDTRYGHSPLHVNSGSSFHGSPGSQSPHGSGQGSRNGQARYSPDE